MTPLAWFFDALWLAALVVEVWAFVDALRRPTPAFTAANKLTKPLWLIITGVACVVGLASLAYSALPLSLFPIVAFVAAAIYLADVRPKVREFKSGGTSSGPYGPW